MNTALRPLRLEDIPQVAEIEREAFPTLPPTPFKRELDNRLGRHLVAWVPRAAPVASPRSDPDPPSAMASGRPLLSRLLRGVKALVSSQEPRAEVGHLILGFVSLWFMAQEAHITSIAVKEAWRGRGIGELLLIGAIEMALARPSRVVSLEVRASNAVAQALYEKYGFRKVGLRKGYYTDNYEDAVIMTTDPINTIAYREMFRHLVESYRQRRGEIVMVLA